MLDFFIIMLIFPCLYIVGSFVYFGTKSKNLKVFLILLGSIYLFLFIFFGIVIIDTISNLLFYYQ